MSINAGTVYSELVLDMSRYEQGLRQAEQQMNTFASNLGKIGKNMEKVGKELTTKVTLPIVGIGAAATKLGLDFQSGMSEVGAISGATGAELAILEKKARDMGATTKFSASDAADALKFMAMAGWETNAMLDGIDGVMALAAASGEALGMVSDIVTDSLTAFGMEAKQAGEFADLLASASSNSNTNVALMGETFKYVAPLFGALGYSAEDAALATGLMANAGIKGSQSGTTLRAAVTNLIKPTDAMAGAMKKLGLSVTDSSGEMLPFKDVMDQLRDKFSGLTEEQKANYAATIFGKEAMSGMLAVINASPADYEKLTKATREYNGAAKEMSDVMQDNLKGRWEEFKSGLEEAALQIYDLLLPSLEKWLAKGQDFINWFQSLDEGTKQTMINIAGFAAAMGPILLIGGKFATSISSIVGLYTKFTAASTVATAATGATATGFSLAGAAAKAGVLLLNPWVLGIGAATIAGIALYKHLQQDSIPAIELFGEEVSESTQKAVGGFLELNDKATLALNQLKWSSQEVTEEMADSITGTFEQMGQQIVLAMKSDHEEQLATMRNFFEKSSALTAEEEAEIVVGIKKHQEQQAGNIQIGQDRIAEILNTAKEEKRSITEKERNKINRIQQAMTEKAVEYMSDSEREQKVILERLRIEASKITAQQAAEVVRNSLEQKNKVVLETEEQYKKTIAEIIKQRDEAGTISKEQADKLIEEATRQKDETVKNAEKMHSMVVYEAKQQAVDHVKEVDWSTGEIKSKWQVMKEDVIYTTKRLKEETVRSMSELATDVVNKYEELKTNTTKKVEEMKEDIINKWKQLKEDAVTWGRNVVEGFINGVNELYTKAVNTVENLGDSIAKGIKSVLKIQSPSKVMEGVGKNIAEGLAVGIEKNSSKAIQEAERMAQATARQFDTLGNAVITALRKRYQEEERVQIDSLRRQTENIRRETDERIKEYDRELAAKLKLLDDGTNDELRQLQEQIGGINDKTKQEEKELEEQEYQKKLAAKQKELIEAKSAEEQLKIIDELNQLKSDRERKLLLESRQLQIEELRSEMDRIRVQAQEKRNELQMEYEEKKRIEIQKSSVAIEALDREMEATKIHFAKLLEEDKIQAEARRLILDENNKELVELLGTYNPKWQDAGRSFGENLLEGLNSTKQSIQNAVSEMLSMVGQTEMASARLSSQNDIIMQAKRDWTTANEIGDTKGMAEAHKIAETARKSGGTIQSTDKLYGNNAHGTNYWQGGLTWVGEQGPELIELPQGSKVYSNQKSEEMVSSQGKGITQNIHIYSPTPLSPSEIARKNLQASRQLAMEWGM